MCLIERMIKQSFEGNEGIRQEDTWRKRIPDKAKTECHHKIVSVIPKEQ